MYCLEQRLKKFMETMRADEEDMDALLISFMNQLEKEELLHEIETMTCEQIRELLFPFFKEKVIGLSSI
ncbi:hypothetical protein [Bacillus alveayuensis]|jgi:hypothetical protein|uniref:FAD assembly factor SdhE n=1 Tax=Aeribacillus alveayuensis TaxID=279215 RepID=A0ABT9VJ10_9BACI|nr:hypothetical protein [Bacillus alveayuensis]MDQ0160947.1 hypothetical protein [Bacillus alveayuensis]